MSSILKYIQRPGRYLGQEHNIIQKKWSDASVRFSLVFPDLYEIGMSHHGLQILYHIINSQNDLLAERCYCPDKDVEILLKKKNERITTLETNTPLLEFDIVGITLPYELCFTNILTLLDLSDIPFHSVDRTDEHPLIIGGGANAFNPEPVADFFDAILLGDGEEAILEIAHILKKCKKQKLNRNEIIFFLSEVEGIYIPAYFQPTYNNDNTIHSIDQTHGHKNTITRRVIPSLDDIEHLKKPLVPNSKIIHDRLGIEVARGCTRSCRFCQAGITYRPVRERSPEKVLELANSTLNKSGFEELALLSLSTGDYSCLEYTLTELMDNLADDHVSVALPSMRVGTLSPAIMEQIKRVRKTGFTLAPEAGSDRLRRVINKGITEKDLLDTCHTAFSLGWQKIKFYFMVGLPTEIKEDRDEIANLIRKVLKATKTLPNKKQKLITVSIGTFIPKPHTPFQWERQLPPETSRTILHEIRQSLPGKSCDFKYHDPYLSFLEGVFSRGDRRLGKLVIEAWSLGARLDGWDEHFDLAIWQKAAKLCSITLDYYLDKIDPKAILPWNHLQTGASTDFLLQEREKGFNEEQTEDCRFTTCQKCGLCNFSSLQPIVHNKEQKTVLNRPKSEDITFKTEKNKQRQHYKYFVQYNRTGPLRFLGHLELLRVAIRSLRRASIPIHYSQGFNPSPKISFGPALPSGTTSYAEFFVIDLKEPLQDIDTTVNVLNSSLPPGIEIKKLTRFTGKLPQSLCTSYNLHLPVEMTKNHIERISFFKNKDQFIVQKKIKNRLRDIDIAPLIRDIQIIDTRIVKLEIIATAGQPSIKPTEAISAILTLSPEQTLRIEVEKTGWYGVDKNISSYE